VKGGCRFWAKSFSLFLRFSSFIVCPGGHELLFGILGRGKGWAGQATGLQGNVTDSGEKENQV